MLPFPIVQHGEANCLHVRGLALGGLLNHLVVCWSLFNLLRLALNLFYYILQSIGHYWSSFSLSAWHIFAWLLPLRSLGHHWCSIVYPECISHKYCCEKYRFALAACTVLWFLEEVFNYVTQWLPTPKLWISKVHITVLLTDWQASWEAQTFLVQTYSIVVQ